MRIVGAGHGLLALVVAGIAVFNLVYGDAAMMGSAMAAQAPWQKFLVHVSVPCLLVASAGLVFPHTALRCTAAIAAYQVICVIVNAPAIVVKPLSFGAWYGVCEALTAVAGTAALYVTLSRKLAESQPRARADLILRAAHAVFALTCVFYGASHFAFAEFTASMVPAWLPGRLGFAYFTGGCYIAAGLAILLGALRQLAALLVASMISLFGLLVWVPSFYAQPKPAWASPPQNEWLELLISGVLAAAAWIVSDSLRSFPGKLPGGSGR